MLRQIADVLSDRIDRNKWLALADRQGKLVARARRYVDGDHDARLTAPMRRMLRMGDDLLSRFNMNYCPLIVETMADRLIVASIQASDETAQEWADALLEDNRFDALQMDLHEALLTDGDAFLLVAWDNDLRRVTLHVEEAYDGAQGMIPVYDRASRQLVAAVKCWDEGDTGYANVYYADRVVKYAAGGDGLALLEDAPWAAGVLPVVHYRNKVRRRRWYGESEILNVVPLQDALNRNTVSMVMTAELSAFQIRVAKGFVPPADLTPGMWVEIVPDDTSPESVSLLNAADAYAMEQAQLVPFIQQGNYIVDKIATISRTPIPGTMGGVSESGEALKQREAPLLAKVRKAQVRVGNHWEDTLVIAARVQNAYGDQAVPPARYTTRWEDAQTRSDRDQIENAVAIADYISQRELLRLIGVVYGYDSDQIDRILADKQVEGAAAVAALGLPGFDQFGTN